MLDLDENFDFYSANNTLTSTAVSYDSDGEITDTEAMNFTNKYNSSNFLSEVFVGDAKNSEKLTITY